MSTKKETKTTVDYNKPALNTYNALQPQILSGLQQYLGGDLINSPFFQQALAFMMPQASRLGQRGVGNVFQNLAASGMSGAGMPGYLGANLGRAGRATSGLQANAFWNAFSQANQARLAALSQAQGYQPLQMGQTSVQKVSGLGTWLPQLIGGVAAAVPGMMTGQGISSGMQGALGSAQFPGMSGGSFPNLSSMGGWAGIPGTSPSSGGWLSAPPPAPAPWNFPCWIAEVLWGVDDRRTHLLRKWLVTVWEKESFIGRVVVGVYRRVGQQVAKLASRSRLLQRLLRPLFNSGLRRAEVWQAAQQES